MVKREEGVGGGIPKQRGHEQSGSLDSVCLQIMMASRGASGFCWWKSLIAPCIGIASSDQVQRQQRRDEPVRENTHLVLDTLASRLRSYHSIVRS